MTLPPVAQPKIGRQFLEMSVPTGSAQDGPHKRRDTRRRQPAR